MSTLVSSLVNVLNSRSPFVVATADEEAASQTDTTTLTPSGINESAVDIAYAFSPAANLSQLSRPAASVLLTEQASVSAVADAQRPNAAVQTIKSYEPHTSFIESLGQGQSEQVSFEKPSTPVQTQAAFAAFEKTSQLSNAFSNPAFVNTSA